jgi:Arc/MetJ-type ribon-helix-helix transcriptional regulator
MFERQTGVYIGSKIPQTLKKAIRHAVISGNYLNCSDFIRDAIKEKLQREDYLLFEKRSSSVQKIGESK